ncbi:MAG: hypothetical protein ACLP6W_01365 [Bryobacteraceae bacterium]|jgi:hypothetical protein
MSVLNADGAARRARANMPFQSTPLDLTAGLGETAGKERGQQFL